MKYYLIIFFCCIFIYTACGQNRPNITPEDKSDLYTHKLQGDTEKRAVIQNRRPTINDVNLFMEKRSYNEFNNLRYLFRNADSQFEILLYAIIATDKFDIVPAYYEVACCLTNCLSYLTIGKHSKEMATHYLEIGAQNNKICVDAYNSLDARRDNAKMWMPKRSGNTLVKLKTNSLMGSITDYNNLKKTLLKDNKYDYLLYYSYIMAERYDYTPAKKDIIDIINKAYKKYNLGEYGKETDFFCSFFKD